MVRLHQRWGNKGLKLLVIDNLNGCIKLLSSGNYAENGDNFLALQVWLSSHSKPESLCIYQLELIFIDICPDINVKTDSALCFKKAGQSCGTRMSPKPGGGIFLHGVGFRSTSVGDTASRWSLASHLHSWMIWRHRSITLSPPLRAPKCTIRRPAFSLAQDNRSTV